MTMGGEENQENPSSCSLEQQAIKRREKLLALKRKRSNKTGSGSDGSHNQKEALPVPLFRSYKPLDKQFQDNILDEAKPKDVSSEVKDQLESAKSAIVIDHLDVTSLAPRKPDWDLKRDITKKIEKLERQTQKAIAELIRDRLKEKGEEDLAEMVNAGAEADLSIR